MCPTHSIDLLNGAEVVASGKSDIFKVVQKICPKYIRDLPDLFHATDLLDVVPPYVLNECGGESIASSFYPMPTHFLHIHMTTVSTLHQKQKVCHRWQTYKNEYQRSM